MFDRKKKVERVKGNRFAGQVFSYKEVDMLKRFVSEQGYIVGREKTGLSQKQQRGLARAIKRARHLVMLPFTQTV